MREVRRRCYDDGFRRDALELIKAGAGKDTHDNDTEFARHARSRDKLGMDTCFVYPYSSWRRENNGNRNGVVRRQLPKRCEIRMDMVRGLREIVDEPLESQGQQGRCTSK